MKRIIKYISALAVFALLATQMLVFTAFADSVTVNGSSSVTVGNQVTVTITVKSSHHSGTGAFDGEIKYDSGYLQLVSASASSSGAQLGKTAGKIVVSDFDANGPSNFKYTLKFKALKAGKTSVSVSGDVASADVSTENYVSGSKTISIVNKAALSSNANLKSLKISAGTLSPAFDPNITSYDVRLTYEQTQVLVTATTAEYSASCYVEGSSTMKVGQNKRVIVVTAPNGTVKKYTLNIHRDENPGPNPYEITVGADKKYIVTDYKNINIPFGYELSKYTINATSMSVMYDKVSDAVLVYATNKDGTGGSYYSMDKESGAFTEYKFFLTGNTQYVALEPEAGLVAPVGYYYAPVEIMGYTVNAFKYDDEAYADFIIFFARTKDGQTGFFRYDVKDSSVQRAIEFTAALSGDTTVDTPNVESEKSFWQKLTELEAKSKIVLIAGIVAILVIIAIVVILIVGAVRNKKPEDETFVMPDSIDLKEEFTDSLEQMRDLSDFADSSEIDFPETEDTDINE